MHPYSNYRHILCVRNADNSCDFRLCGLFCCYLRCLLHAAKEETKKEIGGATKILKFSFLSPRKVPRYECLQSSPLVVLTQQDTCRKQSIRQAQCDIKLIDGYGYLL